MADLLGDVRASVPILSRQKAPIRVDFREGMTNTGASAGASTMLPVRPVAADDAPQLLVHLRDLAALVDVFILADWLPMATPIRF